MRVGWVVGLQGLFREVREWTLVLDVIGLNYGRRWGFEAANLLLDEPADS